MGRSLIDRPTTVTEKMKRLKEGDLLQLRVGSAFAYVQYIGKHERYGEAIRVKPATFDRQMKLTTADFADAYVTFYPASLALSRNMVEIAGHFDPPRVPTRYRRTG